MKTCLIILLVAAPWLLCSCGSSTSSRRSEKSLAEMTMEERRGRSMKALTNGYKTDDPKFRSQYDKAARAVLSQGKEGSAGWFSRQKHSARDFNGVKTFNAGNQFQTKTFSGADDQNWMGRKALSERDKVPAFADNQFSTNKSRFADEMAREAGQTSRFADDVFKTRMDPTATKSQKKNNLPQIIELPEQAQGSAYTEDQVKKLLGR